MTSQYAYWTCHAYRRSTVNSWEEVQTHPHIFSGCGSLFKCLISLEIIPRSINMVTMEGISYLLVALGDGCLIYYTIDQTGTTLFQTVNQACDWVFTVVFVVVYIVS